MARGAVRIPIIADASGVARGTAEAQASLASFSTRVKETTTPLKSLTSNLTGLGLAFGIGGVGLGVRDAVDAFKNLETSNARVTASLKTLGVNTTDVRDRIQTVIDAQTKMSGFQENDLKTSFGTLLQATGSYTKALSLNSLAMDFARGRQISVTTASNVLAKVIGGNVGLLNRYSVGVAKGTSVTQALALVQQKYAGQAKTFGDSTAGAADKASASIEILEQKVGGQLAPAMNDAASATITFANATGHLIESAGGLGPILAGGAGFGAFKLLGPSIGNAASALGALGTVAGEKGAGTSFKVLGSAIADSVSPMTLAAVGAGLLAGGIYEIWHNSESASQAMQGFDKTVLGVQQALSQRTVARNAVNDAKDLVTSTTKATQAARDHAAALHDQLVAAQSTLAVLQANGASASKLKTAQDTVTSATKAWSSAMAAVVPIAHQQADAQAQLHQANQNLVTSTQGVSAAQDAQTRKAQDMISKANAAATQINSLADSGHRVAGGFNEGTTAVEQFIKQQQSGAAATAKTNSIASTTHATLALLASEIGKLPSIKTIEVVSKYAAEGESIDQIVAKLGLLQSKTLTITTKYNPITGTTTPPIVPKKTASTGAWIGGSWTGQDSVPVNVGPAEVILNPMQQNLVNSGLAIDDALKITGAPVIGPGSSHAGGGSRGGASNVVAVSGGGRDNSQTPAAIAKRVANALGAKQNAWDLAEAKAQLGIAQASESGDPTGNANAYAADQKVESSTAAAIQAILNNPAKALGIPGAKLSSSQRTALINAKASAINQYVSDGQTIYGLQHPDDTGSTDTSSSSTSDDADLQAQLAQAQQVAAVASRGQQLSDTALRALTATGSDIGTDQYGNVFSAGAKVGVLQLLGDPRSLQGFAAAATQGLGMQASVQTNRAFIGPS